MINTKDWKVKIVREKENERLEYIWLGGYKIHLYPSGYKVIKDDKILYQVSLSDVRKEYDSKRSE